MHRRLGWAAVSGLCLGLLIDIGAALAQPSQAQIGAVRSNCRSDYMQHCSSVTPGGADALHCLERNAASLSSSCRAAVDALKPPPAASAPPPPTPAAAPAAAPAQQPQRTATPAPAAAPTAAPAQQQRAPAPRTAAAPPAPPAPPPSAAPIHPAFVYTPMPPLLPRMQLAIIRACDADRQAICSMVPMGGGRIIECLARNEPALTPYCRDTMAAARASAMR